MTVNEAKRFLPKVGEQKKGGIVVQVDEDHLWYRVKKHIGNTMISECYRVLDGEYMSVGSCRDTSNWTIDGHKKLVRCINTGKIFKRCEDAGREYGISKYAVRRAARTGARVGEDYYMFEYVSRKAGDVSA